ncbi:MAG: linear amide C-N hydrolase [Treponema sp.]
MNIKKIISFVLLGLVLLTLIFLITIYSLWTNEISTVMSIKKLREKNDTHMDGSVYEMYVKGGFYFDEFLKQGGAKNDGELIKFITSKITKGLLKMDIKESEIACSSFTAKTEDGDVLFARNYDFAQTNTCIVYTKPNNGRHSSISTVDLQFVGIKPDKEIKGTFDKITSLAAPFAPLDGINDAGVSCGIYMTYQGEKTVATDQNTDKPDITSTTMLRLVLDYASNVDEAVELISKYDLHDSARTSYHYMIADASGRSAILEWVNGTDLTDNDGSKRRLIVIYNDGDAHIGSREAQSKYQVVTNFVIQPDYYESDDEKAGYDRYETLYNELSKTNAIVKDEKEAMRILSTVGRRNWNNKDKNTCTVHSVVYNLTKKTALWVPNENYDDETAYFNLELP